MKDRFVSTYRHFVLDTIRQLAKTMNTKRAVSLSVVLHLLVAVALAGMVVTTTTSPVATADDVIEFDLTTVKYKTDFGRNGQSQSTGEAGTPNANAQAESGRASTLLKGNMNRESVMMASLAGLDALKSSFSFMMQKTVADSLGGFSPTHGDIPGSAYDSFGYRKGDNLGRGNGKIVISGGGLCAPSALPNPGK